MEHAKLEYRIAAIKAREWLHPMERCHRGEIPQVSPICADFRMLHKLQNDLKHAAGGTVLEVLYDRATCMDAAAPGWHVYKLVTRGAVPSEDVLARQWSCKIDMNLPYTPENARMPGSADLEWFKMKDKARMPGTIKQINDKIDADHKEHHDSIIVEGDKNLADAGAELDKEHDTFVHKGRNGIVEKLKRKAKRAPPSPKTTSYDWQKSR